MKAIIDLTGLDGHIRRKQYESGEMSADEAYDSDVIVLSFDDVDNETDRATELAPGREDGTPWAAETSPGSDERRKRESTTSEADEPRAKVKKVDAVSTSRVFGTKLAVVAPPHARPPWYAVQETRAYVGTGSWRTPAAVATGSRAQGPSRDRLDTAAARFEAEYHVTGPSRAAAEAQSRAVSPTRVGAEPSATEPSLVGPPRAANRTATALGNGGRWQSSALPPLPCVPRHATGESWKRVPPPPLLTATAAGPDAISLTWDSLGCRTRYAAIARHELFVYTKRPPRDDDCGYGGGDGGEDEDEDEPFAWRQMADLQVDALPAECVLLDCPKGEHHLAVRAVDEHDRRAPFAFKTVWL